VTSKNLADSLRPADAVNGAKWAAPANVPHGITSELPLTPGVREIEPPPYQIGHFVMEFDDA
jgi:hypothetical protein